MTNKKEDNPDSVQTFINYIQDLRNQLLEKNKEIEKLNKIIDCDPFRDDNDTSIFYRTEIEVTKKTETEITSTIKFPNSILLSIFIPDDMIDTPVDREYKSFDRRGTFQVCHNFNLEKNEMYVSVKFDEDTDEKDLLFRKNCEMAVSTLLERISSHHVIIEYDYI